MRSCRELFAGAVAAAILLIPLHGCGKSQPVDPNRSTVSGTITFNGKPLPAGTMVFAASDSNIAATVSIKSDGTYSTDRAPLGKNMVTVDTTSIKVGNPSAYVAIPERYADSSRSGLTCDIKPGENANVNFELKP